MIYKAGKKNKSASNLYLRIKEHLSRHSLIKTNNKKRIPHAYRMYDSWGCANLTQKRYLITNQKSIHISRLLKR